MLPRYMGHLRKAFSQSTAIRATNKVSEGGDLRGAECRPRQGRGLVGRLRRRRLSGDWPHEPRSSDPDRRHVVAHRAHWPMRVPAIIFADEALIRLRGRVRQTRQPARPARRRLSVATPLALHEGPKPDTITNPSLSLPAPPQLPAAVLSFVEAVRSIGGRSVQRVSGHPGAALGFDAAASASSLGAFGPAADLIAALRRRQVTMTISLSWAGLAFGLLATLFIERVMDAIQHAINAPIAKVTIDGAARSRDKKIALMHVTC